ncbi:MAG: hypothetical protein QOG52_1788, partial [Frankiaceae bacterium]|nr:hypothetical protein [Frankiaceae bacterium]
WVRVFAVVLATLIAAGLASKRGVLVAAIAAVVYGLMAICWAFARERTVAWSKRHPVLDGLVAVPLLFLALGYITTISTGLCAVAALLAGGLFVGLAAALRRRRGRLQPSR